MFTLQELRRAQLIIGQVTAASPQREWPLVSARLGTSAVVKHENHLPTGAFKVRGGLIYVERLQRERSGVKGIISATRGNHGQSLALAAGRYGVPVTIVVPHGNNPEKNSAMIALGARLIEHGADFDEAREEAKRIASRDGLEMVPSFHRDLVLGVATYALELLEAESGLSRLYVPVGLGSGICGCILVRDLLGLATEIVGVQAAGAPSYALSFQAGSIVTTPEAKTFADGAATRIPDPAAFDIIRRGVADIVTVEDQEIGEAIRAYWTDTHNLAEGAGAMPLAAALKQRGDIAGKRIGLVLSGGNIDIATFLKNVPH
ncbi:threonine dehydratase [Steroidobacter sp.]|uniref:threonine dehydratase n=1 Tax=Steroidobacter sp. TaxID=1978227 RepID=UPI001A3D649D|nr:threonine dehydratase [Steroidobacter sp.]MBL8270471.1 threonine dehydratase [Steroidobacter sp.]